jgi:hypothetical protein
MVQLHVTRDCGVGVCFTDEQCDMGRVTEKPVNKSACLAGNTDRYIVFRTSLVKFGQFPEV